MSDVADGPSRHGALLGAALADLAEMGAAMNPSALPDPCATCAFRRGTVPNQSAGTGKLAMDILLRIDPSPFGCHHGMNGEGPTRLCSGAAMAASCSFEAIRERFVRLGCDLGTMRGPDDIRATYDGWLAQVDPDSTMDVYQIARAWERVREHLQSPKGQGLNTCIDAS